MEVNAQEAQGYTPLHSAVITNQVAISKILIAQKANVNTKEKITTEKRPSIMLY